MIFEMSREEWKQVEPLKSSPGFLVLVDCLKRYQANLNNSLLISEGVPLARCQGEAQLLKMLFESLENEPPITGETRGG